MTLIRTRLEKDVCRVAIVGGGLAGMSAAAGLIQARISKQKLQIELFEIKSRLGGRAGSFLDRASGQDIDYCQHVGMGCCTNLIYLLKWADILKDFQRYDKLNFVMPGQSVSEFEPDHRLPAPLHLAKAFAGLKFLTDTERKQIQAGLWALMRLSPRRVAKREATSRRPETMGNWLRRQGQDDATILKFWNVVLASALGEHVDAVAILPARKVFIDGFIRARGAADVLVPTRPLSELFGQLLPQKLIESGVQIHTGVHVRQCVLTADGRIEVRIDHKPKRLYDHVVLAVPWFALPKLLGRTTNLAASVPRLDEFGLFPSSPISGVHLWLDRELTQLPHAVIVGALSQWIFRSPHVDQNSGPGEYYYQVVISASHDVRGRPAKAIVDQVVAELNSVFPADDGRPAQLLRSKLVTDPAAVFSITPSVERSRPQTRTELPNLFLAGDWTQTGWPATMEGAVLSGFSAATEIAKSCGVRLAVIQRQQTVAPLSWLLTTKW